MMETRIEYVYSASSLIGALDVNVEVEKLRTVLKKSQQRVCFRAEVATVANFGKLLTRGVTVLHLSSHGYENGDLMFENEQGELHPLRVANLRELITGHTGFDVAQQPAAESAMVPFKSPVASSRALPPEKRRSIQVK